MKQHPSTAIVMIAVAILMMVGCREDQDQRLVELAQRHQNQQVEQNLAAVELQREVTEGTRRLVEADAQARQEIVALQHDLQSERSEIGRQRDDLEAERRQIATGRRFDSLTAVAITNVGLLLACLLPLLLAWYLLRQPPTAADDQQIVEVMLSDLISDQPKLLIPPDRGNDRPTGHPPRLTGGESNQSNKE